MESEFIGQVFIREPGRKMIRKLLYGAKLLLGRDEPGRNLTIYDDDIFIASYPKSGNTWARFMVANLMHPQEPVTFLNIDHVSPDPDLRSRNFLKKCPRPRVMKSHHPFDARYKRVVYIARDPRDVIVSQYHFQIKRGVIQAAHPIAEFVERALNGQTNQYGSWGQNVGSWLIARFKTPDFLLLRYEDLKERPEAELARVAAFLGLEAGPQQLSQAVQLSSADRMRKLEKVQADKWASTRETRKDLAFVRSAVAGEWKSTLPDAEVERIERAWGNIMRVLGYQTVTSPTAGAMQTLLNGMEFPADDVRT